MTAERPPPVSNQFPGTAYGPVVQAQSITGLTFSMSSSAAVPSSMRGDLADFTGRSDDVRQLSAMIASSTEDAARGMVVYAVDGMPGVGKTAFCVHVAHQMANRFPDGQIFLELHGHTPGQDPVLPERALHSLLIATGLDPILIPADLDDQARLWRDRLTGRKMLVLLDDAASVDQVRPLLPGTADCLVLITSRRYLGGLAGVRSLTLHVVSTAAGVAMLRRIARHTAIASAPTADLGDAGVMAEIVARCGCLPLAIALVAARWRSHPTWDARYLAGLLTDAHDRLEHLQTGNESVRAAFDMSFHHLPSRLRRTFRLLGVLVGPEFDTHALAALTDTSLRQARQDLEELHNDHLVQETAPGRYRLHDLLRAYAQSGAMQLVSTHRKAAVDRVIDYYLRSTLAAASLLPLRQTANLPSAGAAPAHLPRLDTVAQARAWLGAELPVLIAYLDHASTTDQNRAIQLAGALEPFLTLTRDTQQAGHVSRTQLAAAIAVGDRTAQAGALNNLGQVQYRRGEYDAATATLARAHEIFVDIGDRLGQANARNDLGQVQYLRGEYDNAVATLTATYKIFIDVGDRLGQANALNHLGHVEYHRGEYDTAVDILTRAHEIFVDIDHRLGQANALNDLGRVQYHRGDYDAAITTLTRAQGICVGIGAKLGQANALNHLGHVQYLNGEYDAAVDSLTQAYEIFVDIGHRLGQANVLNDVGCVQYLRGEHRAATVTLAQAHRLFSDVGDQEGLAEVLNNRGNLAMAHSLAGDPAAYFGQALDIARRIGVPLQEAEARHGLARLLLHQHNTAQALPLLTQARSLCPTDHSPIAVAIDATLAELSTHADGTSADQELS